MTAAYGSRSSLSWSWWYGGGGQERSPDGGDCRQPVGQDDRSRWGARYDAAEKIKGRKRHLAVDTLGLPIKGQVTAADVQDRSALPDLLAAVSRKSPWVKLAFVDGGYAGDETERASFEASRIRIRVVKRTDTAIKGFFVLPKRWIVERTFGWLNRSRRLAKDFETLVESSKAWLLLALAALLVRRVARDYRMLEFSN